MFLICRDCLHRILSTLKILLIAPIFVLQTKWVGPRLCHPPPMWPSDLCPPCLSPPWPPALTSTPSRPRGLAQSPPPAEPTSSRREPCPSQAWPRPSSRGRQGVRGQLPEQLTALGTSCHSSTSSSNTLSPTALPEGLKACSSSRTPTTGTSTE